MEAHSPQSNRPTFEKEIKRTKFIAIAGPISNELSAHSFLIQAKDPRATHTCWAYRVGDQYQLSDDGELSGTTGNPIHYAIVSFFRFRQSHGGHY